jgi:DNA-binding NarL/FixJ family response regulator
MNLTPKELEVLQLMCSGLTGKQIAYRLKMATGTVRYYGSSLRKKSGSTSPQQLGAWAAKQELV